MDFLLCPISETVVVSIGGKNLSRLSHSGFPKDFEFGHNDGGQKNEFKKSGSTNGNFDASSVGTAWLGHRFSSGTSLARHSIPVWILASLRALRGTKREAGLA
jgi:hypothetical protein